MVVLVEVDDFGLLKNAGLVDSGNGDNELEMDTSFSYSLHVYPKRYSRQICSETYIVGFTVGGARRAV